MVEYIYDYNSADDLDYEHDYLYSEILPTIEHFMDNSVGFICGTIKRWDGTRTGVTPYNCYMDLIDFIEDTEIYQVFFSNESLDIVCTHHDGVNVIHIKTTDEDTFSEFKDHEDEYTYKDVMEYYNLKSHKPTLLF